MHTIKPIYGLFLVLITSLSCQRSDSGVKDLASAKAELNKCEPLENELIALKKQYSDMMANVVPMGQDQNAITAFANDCSAANGTFDETTQECVLIDGNRIPYSANASAFDWSQSTDASRMSFANDCAAADGTYDGGNLCFCMDGNTIEFGSGGSCFDFEGTAALTQNEQVGAGSNASAQARFQRAEALQAGGNGNSQQTGNANTQELLGQIASKEKELAACRRGTFEPACREAGGRITNTGSCECGTESGLSIGMYNFLTPDAKTDPSQRDTFSLRDRCLQLADANPFPKTEEEVRMEETDFAKQCVSVGGAIVTGMCQCDSKGWMMSSSALNYHIGQGGRCEIDFATICSSVGGVHQDDGGCKCDTRTLYEGAKASLLEMVSSRQRCGVVSSDLQERCVQVGGKVESGMCQCNGGSIAFSQLADKDDNYCRPDTAFGKRCAAAKGKMVSPERCQCGDTTLSKTAFEARGGRDCGAYRGPSYADRCKTAGGSMSGSLCHCSGKAFAERTFDEDGGLGCKTAIDIASAAPKTKACQYGLVVFRPTHDYPDYCGMWADGAWVNWQKASEKCSTGSNVASNVKCCQDVARNFKDRKTGKDDCKTKTPTVYRFK